MHEGARSKADPAASVSTSGAEWRLDLAPAAAAARLRGRGRRRRWAALPADPGRGVDKTQSGARLAARRRSRGSPRGAWRGRGRSRPAHAHAPIYARPLTRTHTLHVYTYADMDLYAHTLPDSVHVQFDLVSLKWLMNQIPKCSSSSKVLPRPLRIDKNAHTNHLGKHASPQALPLVHTSSQAHKHAHQRFLEQTQKYAARKFWRTRARRCVRRRCGPRLRQRLRGRRHCHVSVIMSLFRLLR